MTIYPSIGDYDLAVTHLHKFVKAPQFAGGSPLLRQTQILAYSGGYSVVYPINVRGKKIALRCWIKDPGHVKERYSRVKAYLTSNPTPYLVDFGYVDIGIVARGNTYPVSYMEWVDGKTLSQFIDENISKPNAMIELADKFIAMVRDLHSKKIAHGDLQDGNIIVCKQANAIELKLVDYDSLYTPSLQGWHNPDELMGVPDYQHPQRYKKANERADYFSELVIYTSLLAYAEKSHLWTRGQEKQLLFTERDFQQAAMAPTFQLLQSCSPRVAFLARKLQDYCTERDTNRLLPLESVVSQHNGGATGGQSSAQTLEDLFGNPVAPPAQKPAGAPASSPPNMPSSFHDVFGSNPPTPPTPPVVPAPPPVVAPDNPGWWAVSSGTIIRPLGFWGTLSVAAPLSGLVFWASQLPEPNLFVYIILFCCVVPFSYLMTKHTASIFVSLSLLVIIRYFMNGLWDWIEVIALVGMAFAGRLGFIQGARLHVSFLRVFLTTGLSTAVFISVDYLSGTDPGSLGTMLASALLPVLAATILSIIATKVFQRG